MTIAQILELLSQVQAQLVALQNTATQFSQADLDAAVLAAVTPLNDTVAALNVQVVDLQAQVTAFPGQVHDAVLAEDVAIAAKVRPILDALVASLVPTP